MKTLPAWRVWVMAARPRTLSAAITPVLVGSAVAYSAGAFSLIPFLVTALAAVLLQIGTNLANDVFDFKKGADTSARLGPPRVTQQGLLTPQQVIFATILVFAASILLGWYLVWLRGYPIVIIGILSILAGLAYTAGPFPLGYHGLGDLFVFKFFGLIAVMGSYFVHTGAFGLNALVASIPVGCLITALIVINNLRDIPTDRLAGKRTLAVRFGEKFARWEFSLLILAAYLVTFVQVISNTALWPVILSWFTMPLAILLIRSVWQSHAAQLNQSLGMCGQLIILFGITYSSGIVLSTLL